MKIEIEIKEKKQAEIKIFYISKLKIDNIEIHTKKSYRLSKKDTIIDAIFELQDICDINNF